MRTSFLFSTFVFSVLCVTLWSDEVRADSAFEQYFAGSRIAFEFSDDSITSVAKMETEVEIRYRDEGFGAFLRASNDRPFAFQREPFQVEKAGFVYRSPDWSLEAGDFSLVFGRGLALNAVEERAVDRDAQLFGGMVRGTADDVSVTGFWGRHKSDGPEYFVSGVNTDSQGPPDELYGGRADIDLGNLDIGLGWLAADMTRFENPLSTTVTELDVRWRVDDVSLYYESAWLNRPGTEEYSNDGRGQFAEIVYGAGGVSVSGSWVRYRNAAFEYATAPSLKRPDVEDSASHPDDETGWRLDTRVSPPQWRGHAVRVLYTKLDGIDLDIRRFRNFFLEWSSPATDKWTFSASYDRITGTLLYYGAVDGREENWRFTVDGPCALGGSFHFQTRYRTLENEFGDDEELEWGIDWAVSDEFTIGFFRETSTRLTEPPPPWMPGLSSESPGEWNSAFLRWLPDPWSEVEVTIGSQRGGYQCSGGTCAQLPPFDGVKVTYYRVF